MISSDDCGGMRPHMTLTTGVRLIVKEEDAATAIAILNKSFPEFDDALEVDRNEEFKSKINSRKRDKSNHIFRIKPSDKSRDSGDNIIKEDVADDDTSEDSEADNPAICPKCSYDNSMEIRENPNWSKCRKCNTPLK